MDGIELQFATNHVGMQFFHRQCKYRKFIRLLTQIIAGHFLLTDLLLDKMKETSRTSSREGRIVIVSSVAHFTFYRKGICFETINDEPRYYNAILLYLVQSQLTESH